MKKIAALLALALLPATVHAQFFVEGSVGAAKANLDAFKDQGFSTDEATGTWSLSAGYMFNRFLGIEAGYRAFGETELRTTVGSSGTFGGQPFSGAASLKAEAKGFHVGPVFETFIERFRLNARVGMFAWRSDVSASAPGAASYAGQAIPAGGSVEDRQDGLDPYVGLGASYAMTNNAFFGLSWTRFRVLDEIDIDAWEVRLKYAF